MLVNFPDVYYAGKEAEIGELIQLTLYNRIRVLYQYINCDNINQHVLISLSSYNHTSAYEVLEEW